LERRKEISSNRGVSGRALGMGLFLLVSRICEERKTATREVAGLLVSWVKTIADPLEVLCVCVSVFLLHGLSDVSLVSYPTPDGSHRGQKCFY